MGEDVNRIKKYHPKWAIFGLVSIGIGILAICVVGGVWLAHGLGIAFDKWGAKSDYFTDFLGGALGLTVGFVLDKFCIEKINHVFEYKRLMMTINHELSNNRKTLNEFYILLPKAGCSLTDDEKTAIISRPFNELDKKIQNKVDVKKKLDKASNPDETWENYINNSSTYYWGAYGIKIRIVDDVVKNAETVATVINTPFVFQCVRDEIIDRLGEIFDKLKQFDAYWSDKKEKTDVTILAMLHLRDEIDELIGDHLVQCGVKEKSICITEEKNVR